MLDFPALSSGGSLWLPQVPPRPSAAPLLSLEGAFCMVSAIPATAGCPWLTSHGHLIFLNLEKKRGRPVDWLHETWLILLDERGHKPSVLCGAHKTFNTLEAEVSAAKT